MIIVCNKKTMIPMKSIHHGEVFRYKENYYMKIANTNLGIEKGSCCKFIGWIYL